MFPRGPRDARARTRLTSHVDSLPSPPAIEVELVREVSRTQEGFLRVRQVELRNRYEDGSVSAPYRYFLTERNLLDAVAVVLYRRREERVEVVLRSQLRPPLRFRGDYEVPLPALGTGVVQWEIPAGLVEPGERGTEGLFARASAEALEEVGVVLPPARFRLLGPPTSLSPGLIAEKLHFVVAEVLDDDEVREPEGDGHAVEEHSRSVFLPLAAALDAIERELVHDIKTEVGIRRLERHVASSRPENPAEARG